MTFGLSLRNPLWTLLSAFARIAGIKSSDGSPDKGEELPEDVGGYTAGKKCSREEIEAVAEEVLSTLGDSILRLAFSYLHNREDAEDILQETMIKLVTQMPVFENEKPVIHYENLGIGRIIYQLPVTLCEMFLSEAFKKNPIEALDDDTLREKERIQREAQGFDRGKRNFITLTALAATATVAKLAAGALQDADPAPEAPESGETPAAPEEKPADYGLLPIKREFTISPPGSETHKRMYDKCISCHLCVAKCPSHVLKPSGFENGLKGFLQPRVDFAHGFCNFDCTMCGDVCPTGAIRPLTVEEKHLVQMGHVVFIKENCIVYARDEHCGACSEHCPTQAVHMIPYGDAGLTIPETNVDLCVGCGGCEYICPARPHRAIYIEGNPEHVQATPPPKEETVEVEEVDFGF